MTEPTANDPQRAMTEGRVSSCKITWPDEPGWTWDCTCGAGGGEYHDEDSAHADAESHIPMRPMSDQSGRTPSRCESVFWDGYKWRHCALPPEHYGVMSDHGDTFTSWREPSAPARTPSAPKAGQQPEGNQQPSKRRTEIRQGSSIGDRKVEWESDECKVCDKTIERNRYVSTGAALSRHTFTKWRHKHSGRSECVFYATPSSPDNDERGESSD